MAINIFPPILDGYQPAFINSVQEYPIYFNFSDLVNMDEIQNLQFRIYYQDNNENAINTAIYPDGIVVLSKKMELKYDTILKKYYLNIKQSYLKNSKWSPGRYYKVQIRVGTNEPDYSNYFEWKKEQIKTRSFSEWSEIMIIYPLSQINLEILNNNIGTYIPVITTNKVVEFTQTPTFMGKYSSKIYEPVDKYRFLIYEREEEEIREHLLEDSGWIQYENQDKESFSEENGYSIILKHRFDKLLRQGRQYRVFFQIITRNMFSASSNNYRFTIEYRPFVNKDWGMITIESQDNTNGYCQKADEEGMIRLHLLSVRRGLTDSEIKILQSDNEELKKKIPDKWEEGAKVIGNYVLLRSSNKDNYSSVEELTYFTFDNVKVDKYYEDYTVESGVKYQYYIQKENAARIRSNPEYDKNFSNDFRRATPISNFNYSYLGDKERQLKLMYNNSISGYRKVVLESKQDTLNSQFPLIMRNGNTNYSEFSITGLITFDLANNQNYDFMRTYYDYVYTTDKDGNKIKALDNNGEVIKEKVYQMQSESFLNNENFVPKNNRKNYSIFLENERQQNNKGLGLYYKNNLLIPKNKYNKEDKNYTYWGDNNSPINSNTLEYNSYNQDPTDDNIFIERKFREAVMDFLYDGKPKVFRSPTEGNKIVYLMNINLTPEQGLNRIIYNFSATAYEICEYTYENLRKYDLVNFKEFQEDLSEEEQLQFGQIYGYFEGKNTRDKLNNKKELYPIKNYESTTVNLFDLIQEQIKEKMIDSNYEYKVKSITKIAIEPFPKITLLQKILELDKKIAEEKNKEKIDKEKIKKYEEQKRYYYKLQEEINISGRKPFYTLIIDGAEINLNLNTPYILEDVDIKKIYLKNSGAIILNYICKTVQTEREEKVTRFNAKLRTWGQISGIFTNTEDILINYKYDKNIKEKSKIESQISNFKNQTIDLYNTLDIMEVIKQKSLQEIRETWNLALNKYNEELDQYYDINNYYNFNQLEEIAIEGDPGTEIFITSRSGGIDAPLTTNLIKIGETGKIKYFNNEQRMIENIYMKVPRYLIIDYSCSIIYESKGTVVKSEQEQKNE